MSYLKVLIYINHLASDNLHPSNHFIPHGHKYINTARNKIPPFKDESLLPFLSVPATELVPDLRAPRLTKQHLDEEGLLLVGRDHHLLYVGGLRTFVAEWTFIIICYTIRKQHQARSCQVHIREYDLQCGHHRAA